VALRGSRRSASGLRKGPFAFKAAARSDVWHRGLGSSGEFVVGPAIELTSGRAFPDTTPLREQGTLDGKVVAEEVGEFVANRVRRVERQMGASTARC
jgi:hypothetical protein